MAKRIDLHMHSLFSDGELLPSELARRALKPKRTEKIPKRYKDKCSSWKDVYRLVNKNKK